MKSHRDAFVFSALRALVPALLICVAFGSTFADEPKAAPAQPIISPDAPKLTAEQRQKLREHDRLRSGISSLRMAGKLDEGLAAAEKMVTIDREVFGPSHPLVAQALAMVAEVQMGRHDFAGAQQAWEEVLKIHQSWGGADHWRVKDARRMLDRVKRASGLDAKQLARLEDLDRRLRELLAQRRFDQAGQLLEEFLGAQKELLGEKHQDLNTFALLAGARQGRSLLESEKLWRQFLEVCKATRGEQHPEYAKGLTQLATVLIEKGGRDEAKKSFDRAARIYLITLRAFDLDYAPWVLHLARMQGALLRQADRAESLVRLAAEIYETCRGDTDPQYAECLNQLGHMHYDRQSYAQAETLFKQLVEIRKATVGDKHPQYAQSLLALAMVYQAKGSADLATPLYAEAKRIQQQTPTSAAAQTAPALREEASRQVAAGNNSEAEKVYLKLLDVDRRTIGTKHPDYASDLWRLAGLYQSMRADRKAEELYEKAAETFKQTLGEKHRQYRTTLEGLARLAMQRGDYRKADSLYQQLQALYRESDGEDSFRYAFTLDQRGEICKAEGDLEGAAALFEKSLPIFRTRLGQQGLLLTARLSGLAELYTRQQNYKRAEPFLRECLNCNEKTLEEIFSLQSERQRLDALRRARRFLDQYVNIARAAGKSDATALYEHVLRWKGAGAARGQVRLAREQPELKDSFDKWARASARLTELAYAPPAAGEEDAWVRQVHTLRNEKENLESDIARRSEAFRWERQGSRIEPREVANVLPERTVLVDFFEYSGTQEERRLLAFVLRRGHEPVCIEIDGYKGIMRNIERWRSALLTTGSRAETVATELREKLWKPLESPIGGAATVLVAPDGGLAYFPLSALPGARPGTFLLEELAIGYVTSGRQVMEALRAPEGERGRGLLAVGGIDYRADAGSGVVRLEVDKTPLVDAESRAGFGPLPGTELEARRCQELFRRSFPGEPATLLTGAAPSESRFVRECGERYRYLHLATHGFFESPLRVAAIVAGERPTASTLFYADRVRPGQALARLPLLRCGLALAGAGRPPRPGFTANGGGILTAEEVASLDLRATDVAVLSACQTGLGEVERGEGVLGFQRAFHQAGTRALVATLWSVDDAATSLLMEEFYTNLWHLRMPKLEALRQAQLSILRNPDRVKARREELKKILLTKIHEAKAGAAAARGDGKRTPPLFWAAFVLSGDPR